MACQLCPITLHFLLLKETQTLGMSGKHFTGITEMQHLHGTCAGGTSFPLRGSLQSAIGKSSRLSAYFDRCTSCARRTSIPSSSKVGSRLSAHTWRGRVMPRRGPLWHFENLHISYKLRIASAPCLWSAAAHLPAAVPVTCSLAFDPRREGGSTLVVWPVIWRTLWDMVARDQRPCLHA